MTGIFGLFRSPDVDEIEPREVAGRLGSVVLLDVREPAEFATGVIPGAVLLPLGRIREAGDHVDPDAPLVVAYCAHGNRSRFAAEALDQMGYRAVSMRGGVAEWRHLELPWSEPEILDSSQRERYSRHVLLPEVGEDGRFEFALNAFKLIVVPRVDRLDGLDEFSQALPLGRSRVLPVRDETLFEFRALFIGKIEHEGPAVV